MFNYHCNQNPRVQLFANDLQSTYMVSCNRRREEITAECHRGGKTYLVANGGDGTAPEQS